MLAFEYHVNGKKLCTAGLSCAGVVATHIHMVRGIKESNERKLPDDLYLHVGGILSRTRTHVTWLHRELKNGDSIRVDVVEAKKADRPKKKKPESARLRLQREQDYVLKKATSWGWKIQK